MVQPKAIATWIPNEILFQVLMDPYLIPPAFYDRYDFPFRFAHVCREWRDIILTCPELWARIYVWSIEDALPSDLDTNMERCRFHVTHSATVPLEVTFYSHHEELRPVLELLLTQTHRINSFAVDSSTSLLEAAFAKCPAYEFPIMNQAFLAVTINDDEETEPSDDGEGEDSDDMEEIQQSDDEGPFAQLLCRCPKMTSLFLDEDAAGYFLFPAHGWPDLRTLQIRSGVCRIKNVVQHAPNLTEFAFAIPVHLIEDRDWAYDWEETFIRLPSLRTMYVTNPMSERCHALVLQGIDCPNLRRFEALMGPDYDTWYDLRKWLREQQRGEDPMHRDGGRFSAPFTLTSLKLVDIMPGNVDGSPEAFFEACLLVLKTVPMLDNLHLGLTPFVKDNRALPLLQALTLGRPNAEDVCPLLTELTLGFFTYQPADLLSMLVSRRPGEHGNVGPGTEQSQPTYLKSLTITREGFGSPKARMFKKDQREPFRRLTEGMEHVDVDQREVYVITEW